jgi:broad specificity phosphatase PhoE
VTERRPATTVWIARHGQTETNRQGIFCGHSETTLTELGRAQARALGDRLRPIPLTAVYTSDVSRALETAALALEGRDLAARVDPDLREIFYGQWELQKEHAIRRMSPDEYRRMRDEDPAWQPPGGETTALVRTRMFAALQRIIKTHRHHDQVLVVSHGTAITCLLAEVLGMAPSHTFRIDIANTGLSRIEVHDHRLYVTLVNDAAHLAALEGVAR